MLYEPYSNNKSRYLQKLVNIEIYLIPCVCRGDALSNNIATADSLRSSLADAASA